MALARATGFVLRTQDYRETSRIVTFFSAEFGKISLLAKGARRLESRFGAELDLLNQLEVVFYEGKGLKLLKEAHLIRAFPKLKQDYERLDAGLRAARGLRLSLRDGQRDRRIFRLFEELLTELEEDAEIDPEMLLMGFRLKLIDLLGFGPELERCAVCGEPLEEAEVWLAPRAGGLVCERCRQAEDIPLDRRLARSWRLILRLPLRKLTQLALERGLIDEGGRALERFLAYHLHPRL